MAGSYSHCCNDDGSFIGSKFENMICDLGDAYEACEEMHWLIGYLAGWDKQRIDEALDRFYATDGQKVELNSRSLQIRAVAKELVEYLEATGVPKRVQEIVDRMKRLLEEKPLHLPVLKSGA